MMGPGPGRFTRCCFLVFDSVSIRSMQGLLGKPKRHRNLSKRQREARRRLMQSVASSDSPLAAFGRDKVQSGITENRALGLLDL